MRIAASLVWILAAAWAVPAGAMEPASSATAIRPLLIGAELPKLTLKTPDGGDFDLNAAVEAKPTVLIFYRGGW